MKKIGILFGMEDSFPWAFCEEVNRQTGGKDIIAEPVLIDKVEQAVPTDYAVIIDRISQDVPFYRAYLKNAAISGTAVINNPFWWSADEKFFNNSLAIKVGVPVPKTMLLPSKERPTDTSETSFRNMSMPLDWDYMFDQIGFPAYMKPHSGGGWKSVYRVESPEDLWQKHDETGQLVMLLQEEIQFTDYYRCYCLGSKYIHIMPYEPRNPHHLRYATQPQTQGEEQKKLYALMEDYILRLNRALGYDFNTIEFAIRDGIPYAIDFGNPAPDAEITSVGQANFDWIVEHSAKYAIERAKAQKPGQNNLTWGTFVETSVLGENEDVLAKKAQGISTKPTEKKATTKKAAPKKTTAKKSAIKK